MSIKKLLIIGFVTYALVLSGCFSTDNDDDGKDDKIDSVTVQVALDSLASLAGTTEIDSSMKYVKSGVTFTLTEKDTTDDDTIIFDATISSNTASLVMIMVEKSESLTVTMNTAKVIGAGTTFDGTVWQLTSVAMASSDTSATYTLTSSEIQVFYLTGGTVYSVENGVSMDSIFGVLALQIMGVEPIDSTEALDTLASLAGTNGIDSSMSYVLSGDLLGIFETSDTTDMDVDVSAGELTLTMDLEDGSTIEEDFELVLGDGSIEGSIWQLIDVTASNGDTTIVYSLSSTESFFMYLNSGTFYIVENGVNLYEDVLSDLLDALEGFGDPKGTWYVKIYENLYIKTDTSFSSDTLYGDSVYTIVEIDSDIFKTMDYDSDEMIIEVDIEDIDISAGGKFEFDANNSMEVSEKDSVLTITIISDYTDYGEGYHEETFICMPYNGTVPPVYWVVDTSFTTTAIAITTDGTPVQDTILTSEEIKTYKFSVEAGKVYQVVGASDNDDSDADMDIYYMDGTLKVFVSDEEDEMMLEPSSNMTYFIDVASYDDTLYYSIFVKAITVIPTPTAVIGNWYCSSFPTSDTSVLTFNQDSSVFYSTLTADSITVYMMVIGVKQNMKDAIYFASGNKCYFFGEEFDYVLTDTTMSMIGNDMAFTWKTFTGTSFPPDKYVDFGILQALLGDNRNKLFK